ncbi:RNA-directed DNA polymerase, eukaryota, reverse transcriptase zinc-binding domain protein [Tanacetum coccineum]
MNLKKNGGLGVSSLFALNRALIFKWIWRFISNGSSLWSRLITAIHGVKWVIDFAHKSSRSSLWLDIIREFQNLSNSGANLFSLVKKKVGNGEATSFWDDIWTTDTSLKLLFSRLHSMDLNKCCSVAVKMRDPSLISSFRRPPRGSVKEEQLWLLEDIISSVVLSHSSDRWIWRLDSSGDFSVKSTRNYIDDSFLPKYEAPTRWIGSIPIKVNIFAWKVCLDKLPTRLNLSLRGLDIPSILCPICFVAGESSAHLFFSCDLARQLSSKVSRW